MHYVHQPLFASSFEVDADDACLLVMTRTTRKQINSWLILNKQKQVCPSATFVLHTPAGSGVVKQLAKPGAVKQMLALTLSLSSLMSGVPARPSSSYMAALGVLTWICSRHLRTHQVQW